MYARWFLETLAGKAYCSFVDHVYVHYPPGPRWKISSSISLSGRALHYPKRSASEVFELASNKEIA